MAMYKDGSYLSPSTCDVFEEEQLPGAEAPFTGLYACLGCNQEIALNEGDRVPPQNHHYHHASQGAIRWKLIVYADHRAKAALSSALPAANF